MGYMRYPLQDYTCRASVVWGLVYKFACICYRSLDRIFDIVYWPVISLLLWGFTSTFVATTSSFSGVMEFFLGGAVLWSLFWRAPDRRWHLHSGRFLES